MFISILITIIILSALTVSHEFGHYLFARLCGVEVSEFAVGFGPKLFTRRGKNTSFTLKMVPLGGSCSMKGEKPGETDPGSYYAKKPWQRTLIIFAGPLFNFITALILAFVLIAINGTNPPVITYVDEKSPAYAAGLREGDTVTGINGASVTLGKDVSLLTAVGEFDGESVISVTRDGADAAVYAYDGSLGFETYASRAFDIREPLINIRETFREMAYYIRSVFLSLRMLFTGKAGIRDLAGPVGIVSIVDKNLEMARPYGASAAVSLILTLSALFSANLGVFNLLPLPMLDGGRIVEIGIEKLRGKPFSVKTQKRISYAGTGLLIALMGFVLVSDVIKLVM